MKVLFISSGNSVPGISPIVKNQAESLIKIGINVDFFPIQGRGALGYFKNIFKLREYIRRNKYDIYHAHYSLSAIVAALAGCKPLVVSLMGSDVNERSYYRFVVKLFSALFWDEIIVKSASMKRNLGLDDCNVIPNGVDLERFAIMDKVLARGKVGFDNKKKYVLFLSNPGRPEKNYKLAEKAVGKLNDNYIELMPVFDIDNSLIPYYLNAADCIILTSLWEGSPNVIKEAMACNCPLVSTDVGDVRWIIGETEGCYIAAFDADGFSQKLKSVLNFVRVKGRTNGRERIKSLKLDSENIAEKIYDVYKKLQGIDVR